MSVLLHLSDTHFGTERPQVVEALVALAARQRPDVVMLSGDITQRARPAQFRSAKAFVDRLGAPVLAIPGNHDIALFDLWARLTRPYARFAQVFGADLEPVAVSPDWLIVGVNTTRARRHSHGEVSGAQIARVASLLAAARPEQLRVVVVHQPLAVPEAGEASNLLRGHADAARAWAQAGADLVLGGHIHLPFTLSLHGLGAAAVGGTGGHRRIHAHTPWGPQLGQPAALGRDDGPAGGRYTRRGPARQKLPDRAVGLFRASAGVCAHRGHGHAARPEMTFSHCPGIRAARRSNKDMGPLQCG